MRAKNQVTVGVQMISVIFHKRCAPRQIGSDRLHRPYQSTGFPIALSSKAVAVRHQTLHCQPGQLLKPVQGLEVRRKSFESAVLEKTAQTDLDPRPIAK